MGVTHPFMVLPGASHSQRLGGGISRKVPGRDTEGVWTLFETFTLPYAGPLPGEHFRPKDDPHTSGKFRRRTRKGPCCAPALWPEARLGQRANAMWDSAASTLQQISPTRQTSNFFG